MRTLLRLAWALLCFGPLAVGCASPPPGPMPPAPVATPYRIGPSDELTIRVLPEPIIERKLAVAPDGSIAFDLIGQVQVAGRTPDEVAKTIERRIADYRLNPSVTVSLDRATSASVTVLGEVISSGMYPVERNLRVTDAIARAGGRTERAASSRVRLIRRQNGTATTYLSDLDQIHEGDVTTDFAVVAGDLIFVPPDKMVSVGYAIGRALYPLEVIARILIAPFVWFVD
jgi:polysaccharide export outer membrane protein